MRASTTLAPTSASAPASREKMPGWSASAKEARVASRSVSGGQIDADLVVADVLQQAGEDHVLGGRQPLPVGVVVARGLGAQVLLVPVRQRVAQGLAGPRRPARRSTAPRSRSSSASAGLRGRARAAASPSSCSRCSGRRRGCRRPSAPAAGRAASSSRTALAKSRTVRGSERSRFCATSDISRW